MPLSSDLLGNASNGAEVAPAPHFQRGLNRLTD